MARADWIYYRLKHLVAGGPVGGVRSFRVSRDESFVKFIVDGSQPGIQCEAASNATLPKSLSLSPQQEKSLQDMGFAAPDGSSRFFTLARQDTSESTLRTLAGIPLQVLQDIYKAEEDSHLEFEMFLETPRSPRVLQHLATGFLEALMTEGGPAGVLSLESGRIYAQLTSAAAGKEVTCEVVSNQFLPQDLQLAPPKVDQLLSLGFAPPQSQGNFSRNYPVDKAGALAEVANDVLGIFAKVYGLASIPKFKCILSIS